MAQQQWGNDNTAGNSESIIDDDEEEDCVPALSQGSTISNDSIVTQGVRKRRIDFDDEGDEHFEIVREQDDVLGSGERAIAVPRRKKGITQIGGVMDVGQENLGADMDFGEADFLDYELAGDSQMGGI